jgi:hypothetical protein
VHPGPVGPVRIEHRHANLGRHFRLGLEPGRFAWACVRPR